MFVVIVDQIEPAAFTSVSIVVSPVENHIVPEIDMAAAGRIVRIFIDLRMVETRIPAVMVGEHVVMERCVFASPYSAIAMLSLRMVRIFQALREDTPLHGEILVSIERCTFVDGPCHGTMVENDIPVSPAPDTVFTICIEHLVSQTETDETDDDIVSLDYRGVVLYADTVTRCCLPGYREIPVLYPEL